MAIFGAGGGYLGKRLAERKLRRGGRQGSPVAVVPPAVHRPVRHEEPVVVHEEQDLIRRRPTRTLTDDETVLAPAATTGSTRLRRDEELVETRRRRGGKKRFLMLGAMAVGTVLAVRYGLDMGDELPQWVSGLPDTGMDINPWGDGDLDDGNRTGWDLNPTNENLAWNDDPVNPNFRDTGGFDILPPFIDGDWMSMNEGLNVDWPGGEVDASGVDVDVNGNDVDPTTDVDGDRDVDAPGTDAGTPDRELDSPGTADPDVDAPAPPAPAPAPAPAAWVPDMFTVESGNGMTHEIHDMGHQVAGYENFTGADTDRLLEQARERFGDNLLNLPNHAGNDLYTQGGELRISAPGQAFWATQEIEQFMREEMEKLAKAKS